MKFTVAIPAYKASFLKECIDSILAQTYTDFELVIVNDASPEDIDSIVRSYNDSRIRYYVNEKNCGAEHVVDNWNICLSYAKGEYFVLMGDDDVLERNYLETFYSYILKYPHNFIFHCKSKLINEKSEVIGYTQALPELESVYEFMYHRLFCKRKFFISDFVYKTSSLKEKSGFYKLPLAWASDDITAYIHSRDKGIIHINEPVFNYRINSFTITSTGNIPSKIYALELELAWIKEFLREKPKNSTCVIFYKNILRELPSYYLLKRTGILLTLFKADTGLFYGLKQLFKIRKTISLNFQDILLILGHNLIKIAKQKK